MASRSERGAEQAYALKFRRRLRAKQTKPEQRLWSVLRKRPSGVKFRRQHSLGEYIVDFVSLECKLIVELDGKDHEHKVDADFRRQRWLESQGFEVLRYANGDVDTDLEAVERGIANAVAIRKKAPSP